MSTNRILVIGCPGSGKSTLANQLAKQFSLPLVHLDFLFWIDDEETVSEEVFDEQLQVELEKEKWILDGNYIRTLERRMAYADTVVWLEFPRLLCCYRAFKRYFSFKGKMNPQGNPDRFDWDFLTFIWKFNANNRQQLLQAKKDFQTKGTFYHLRNNREVDQFKKSVGIEFIN